MSTRKQTVPMVMKLFLFFVLVVLFLISERGYSQSGPVIRRPPSSMAGVQSSDMEATGRRRGNNLRYTILGSEFTPQFSHQDGVRRDDVGQIIGTDLVFMSLSGSSQQSEKVYSPSIHLPEGTSLHSLKAVAAINPACTGATVTARLYQKSVEFLPAELLSPSLASVVVRTNARDLEADLVSLQVQQTIIAPPREITLHENYYYVEVEASLGANPSDDCELSVAQTLFRLVNVSVGYEPAE